MNTDAAAAASAAAGAASATAIVATSAKAVVQTRAAAEAAAPAAAFVLISSWFHPGFILVFILGGLVTMHLHGGRCGVTELKFFTSCFLQRIKSIGIHAHC